MANGTLAPEQHANPIFESTKKDAVCNLFAKESATFVVHLIFKKSGVTFQDFSFHSDSLEREYDILYIDDSISM